MTHAATSGDMLRDHPIAATRRMVLDGPDWHASSGNLSMAATVPGDLVSDLQAADLIPEPLFDQKTHVAYERRARNDAMVNGIASKFLKDTTEMQRREKLDFEYTSKQNDMYA